MSGRRERASSDSFRSASTSALAQVTTYIAATDSFRGNRTEDYYRERVLLEQSPTEGQLRLRTITLGTWQTRSQ